MMRRTNPSDKLMHPTGDSDNKKGAHHRCPYNGHPLLTNETETAHQSDTGRNKKESKISDKKIRYLIDPHQPYNSQLQGRGEKQHPDDA